MVHRLLLVCVGSILAVAAWAVEEVSAVTGPKSAMSLSVDGTVLPASNDLPTASGQRLVQTFAVDVPGRIPGGVRLVDGDILVGNAISLQAGTASIATGSFGVIHVPAEQVAAVLVTAVSAAAPAQAPATFTGAILVSGERVAGQPSFLNPTHAGVDNGKRVVQIPRERVAALVLHASIPMSKAKVRLSLATGDRISGSVTAAADGAWSLKHELGTWTIPRHQVASWWTESADRTPLSAWPLTATYRDDLDPPLVPLRLDQDTDDGWLRLGRARVDRGLMLRAGTSAEFTIDGHWKSLVAVLGITHGGPAVVRVMQDKKTLWESGSMASGAAAQPCLVPLHGVTAFSIQVVSQVESSMPAYVVVGWPFLLK